MPLAKEWPREVGLLGDNPSEAVGHIVKALN